MRKSYFFLLMLLTVALTASATKHTARYEFKPNGAGNAVFSGDGDYNNHFLYTNYTRVSTLKGYNNQTDQASKTVTIVQGFDNRFAFYQPGTTWNRYYASSDGRHGHIRNNSNTVNIFTVLNLRAGDIVKIKCHDLRTSEAVKNRFIVDHSDNADNNRPWTLWGPNGPNQTWSETTAYHEFIMKEDGDLDLACAPQMELENVQIIYPFVKYNEGLTDETRKVEVNQTITTPSFQLNPNNEDRNSNDETPNIWMEWRNPVVKFCGDLDGTDAVINYNTNNHTVSVSNFTGKGGSVIIMIERYMYVYTVPYKAAEGKAWNFWSSALKVGRSGEKGPEIHSLQAHDNDNGITKFEQNNYNTQGGLWFTRSKEWMNGQNSYLNDETAGLIFWTSTDGDQWDNNTDSWKRRTYGYSNETTVEDGDGVRYIAINKNGGFTIPGLKEKDQVYIYMGHMDNATHDGLTKAGIKFQVWNALDALKVPIAYGNNKTPQRAKNVGDIIFCGGSDWGPDISTDDQGRPKFGRQYFGAIHLYAATDGDMVFKVDGDNDFDFIKLYYIRIYRNNQDIIINTDDMVSNTGGYEVLVRQDANGTFNPTELHTLELRTIQHVSTNQDFEILECSGNLTMEKVNNWCTKRNRGTTTNPWIFDINVSTNEPVYGAFLVRGKDFDHKKYYCVNYCDRVIAVGTLQQMNYPYTWDFKDILGRGASGNKFDADAAETTIYQDSTRIWTKNGSDYEIYNSAFANGNRNWSSGSQLYAFNEYIEEAAGVGFATWNQGGGDSGASRNGDISITSEGVKIIPQHQYGMTRVFVPNLPKPETGKPVRLYLQGKRYIGGTSGFGAYYLTGRAKTPRVNNPWNTKYRDNDKGLNDTGWSSDPLLVDKIKNINVVLGESTDDVEYDIFGYNFTTLELEQGAKIENVEVDDHLTILATEEKYIEIAQGAPSTVNNAAGLQQFGSETTNNYGAVILDQNGNTLSEYDESGNLIIHGVTDKNGNLIYDSDNVSLVTGDDITYVNMVKLSGSGNASSRALKVTGLDASSSYTLKIALKSGNSSVTRALKIYGGSWGSNELATMLARDKVMEKQITVSGTSTLYIGSSDSSIEIYAVYVEESHETTAVKEVPFLAYIDMADAEYYEQNAINVTLYLSDVMLERMAVTTDKKELNIIGWASESRDHYIDHRLNPVFNYVTKTDSEGKTSAKACNVKAYLATGTSAGENGLINKVTIAEVTSPMELSEGNGSKTGCILYNKPAEGEVEEGIEGGIYLFVPPIQDYLKSDVINNASFKGNTCTNSAGNHGNADPTKINAMGTNYMIANLSGDVVEWSDHRDNNVTSINYILSYQYTDGEGVSHPTADETPQERFVRVGHYPQANGKYGATTKPNTAYLQMPKNQVKPANWNDNVLSNMVIVFEGEDQGEIDGIEEISLMNIDGSTTTGTDSYYTLSGQKVNAPTKPGIYVKNGKKVLVK